MGTRGSGPSLARAHPERALPAGLIAAVERSHVAPVGDATGFLSHAWKYIHAQLIGAVEAFFAAAPPEETPYLWLDICTVNQVEQSSFPEDYFYTTFKDGIRAIGRTLLVLQPWRDPIPLKRSWCPRARLAPPHPTTAP